MPRGDYAEAEDLLKARVNIKLFRMWTDTR